MDIRRLQCFLAVAFEGNLTRAAESLFLSQSALSGQIKMLEEELEFDLFVRKARGMELTPEGEDLLPLARNAVQALEDFKMRAARLHAGPENSLTVGLNSDPSFLRMADLARSMRVTVPNLQLSFIVSQSRTTAEQLRSGEMQVGFRYGMWNEEGIHDEFITSVTLGIAIPVTMADQVRMGDWKGLAALPWVYTFNGCPFHVAVRERMSAYGVEVNPVNQAVDEGIVRELVIEGAGVSVLRIDDVDRLVENGHAVAWPETLQVPLCLSYPAGSGYTSPVREFREVVRSVWQGEMQLIA
ncbi:LysR family transcriptional regulator [Pseudodesulfovibrio sp. zrk46]|uniref:LysR family transcriptional regulator n=1 Tax=Pseudodesulfovibrio sp. zrk46 TaxID=2725288 RepID=UPI00144A0903|nr:LysR family transcriptional regulator [Pseudodesulfovibrio sp. zrk46]QJB55656.1 LysR family transcriptional regulator [Pseudodesulfovibrio sp. zrk46]